jgi:hypothetical protein
LPKLFESSELCAQAYEPTLTTTTKAESILIEHLSLIPIPKNANLFLRDVAISVPIKACLTQVWFETSKGSTSCLRQTDSDHSKETESNLVRLKLDLCASSKQSITEVRQRSRLDSVALLKRYPLIGAW